MAATPTTERLWGWITNRSFGPAMACLLPHKAFPIPSIYQTAASSLHHKAIIFGAVFRWANKALIVPSQNLHGGTNQQPIQLKHIGRPHLVVLDWHRVSVVFARRLVNPRERNIPTIAADLAAWVCSWLNPASVRIVSQKDFCNES